MSYYLEVGRNFVPTIRHSEATQAMTGHSDCVKIRTWAHRTNGRLRVKQALSWGQLTSKAKS